ncbi:glycosyltransferase [Granulicella mallensis]|uniref:Glycosyl transferase family 2 n=1 Tax=Granulicella mallensis (strain ATCC BAA-1857 / DSM 23137 / MP5ACTX8) TaxID=682795 RepID=G8P111_GRAMM|nr:glycosyltransferase family 2 protein [Granulicella mallensis]AEU36935.1 glycosyl transferase family 2 [Granulicella mallensis MP5ACTX8]
MKGQLLTMMSVDKTLHDASPNGTCLQRAGIVIPTYNANRHWERLQTALETQGIAREQVLIVDSSSSDKTQELVRHAGYRLMNVSKESFRHGATRQMAVESMPWAEFLVLLTQDAIPCGDHSIETLLCAFNDPAVGAAYGRQLPREQADPIEQHARLFNYPDLSDVRTFASHERLGIKTAFFSNSFAAYRRAAFDEVGGFPSNTIVSEEVTVVARMLLADWKVAYQSDATVIHSHPLTLLQEFSRYFDIGVHHGREQWMLDAFGGAGGEGRTFVLSQMQFLLKTKPSLIPLATLRNASKWCSYQLGLHEKYLPLALKQALSAQKNFWQDEKFTFSPADKSHIVSPPPRPHYTPTDPTHR